MEITLKNVVHHGVEAFGFIWLGGLAVSSSSSACLAYVAGKVAYIASRQLLDYSKIDLTKNIKRKVSWTIALIVGGGVLRIAVKKLTGKTMSLYEIGTKTLAVTILTLGLRDLADKHFKILFPKS